MNIIEIKNNWGNNIIVGGKQSTDHGGFCEDGDDNIYSTFDKVGYIYPVTTIKSFKNKIKAAPTVFSFSTVPSNCPVYEWPDNKTDIFRSQRVLGTANNYINTLEWDRLNTVLGPYKKVNLIIVGFNGDISMGDYQEAKWIGGKKNDLVITFGGNGERPNWCKVFGWTEKTICKRDLESYIMDKGIVGTNFIPFVTGEVMKNYTIKDWKKFDYISIQPATRYYVYYIITNIIIQTILWLVFFFSDVSEVGGRSYNYGYRPRYY